MVQGFLRFSTGTGSRVLKVRRVQTPTLAMLAEREEQIRNFKKERYYSVHILCDGMDAASERVNDKKEADGIAGSCREKPVCVEQVVREEKTLAPPKLYDLTTLQRDASRIFGFTAKQTVKKVIAAVSKADAMWAA